MNREQLRKLIKESIGDVLGVKRQKPKETIKRENLKLLVKTILREVVEEKKKDKVKIDKEDGSYDPQGVEDRVRMEKERPEGKSFEDIMKKLESTAKSIDSKVVVSFDDHKDFNVEVPQAFRVRISPRWENNFDIEAFTEANDRVRVIGLTLDQVCDFIKSNFTDKTKTAVDKAFDKVDKNREDQNTKAPEGMRDYNPVKQTKVDSKDVEKLPKKDDDSPGAPMKQVDVGDIKHQRDHDETKVKPPKHKNDDTLVVKMPGKKRAD